MNAKFLPRLLALAAAAALVAGCSKPANLSSNCTRSGVAAGASAVSHAVAATATTTAVAAANAASAGAADVASAASASVAHAASAVTHAVSSAGTAASDTWQSLRDKLMAALHGIDMQVTQQPDGSLKLDVPMVAFGSGAARPAFSPAFSQIVQTLKQNPDVNAQIVGYTDNTGTAAHNQALSLTRAQSVVHYLEQHGVAARHLLADGRGDADPVASNDTAEGRAKNRRVEIYLHPAQQ